jgi:hypothetical protein
MYFFLFYQNASRYLILISPSSSRTCLIDLSLSTSPRDIPATSFPLDCTVSAVGSALKPLKFITCTEKAVNFMKEDGVHYQCFSNNIQLYGRHAPCDTDYLSQRLNRCAENLFDAVMCFRRLQFHGDKSGMAWFGPNACLHRTASQSPLFNIGCDTIQLVE